jgi:hypothetical protein
VLNFRKHTGFSYTLLSDFITVFLSIVDHTYEITAMLEVMNLVFEATKKECAKKVKFPIQNSVIHIDSEEYYIYILNIQKPNL